MGAEEKRRIYFRVQVLRGQRPELIVLSLVKSSKCSVTVSVLCYLKFQRKMILLDKQYDAKKKEIRVKEQICV